MVSAEGAGARWRMVMAMAFSEEDDDEGDDVKDCNVRKGEKEKSGVQYQEDEVWRGLDEERNVLDRVQTYIPIRGLKERWGRSYRNTEKAVELLERKRLARVRITGQVPWYILGYHRVVGGLRWGGERQRRVLHGAFKMLYLGVNNFVSQFALFSQLFETSRTTQQLDSWEQCQSRASALVMLIDGLNGNPYDLADVKDHSARILRSDQEREGR
eukprot:766454-Hanusia_phi.AAC.13